MDTVDALQEIAIVNKVCSELDNHLGFSDKTLAEYIIHLAVANAGNVNAFQHELKDAGADFPVTVATNLHRVIMAMKQKTRQNNVESNDKKPVSQYPSLAIPNTKPVPLLDMHEEIKGGASIYNESKNDYNSEDDDRNKVTRNGRSRSRSNDRQRNKSDKNPRRSRSRSTSRNRNNRRGDSRERNQRDSRRGDSRERNQRDSRRGDSRERKAPNRNAEPELYGIYDGKISNIMDYGCFVELDGFASRKQGLVHIAQVLTVTHLLTHSPNHLLTHLLTHLGTARNGARPQRRSQAQPTSESQSDLNSWRQNVVINERS
jgi:ATP-dependent RNA helicase DHX8/PRP22